MPAKRTHSAPAARTTVRLPEELHRRAKLAAAWSGLKIQDFIATAVDEYLTNVEQEMSGGDPASGRRKLSPPFKRS